MQTLIMSCANARMLCWRLSIVSESMIINVSYDTAFNMFEWFLGVFSSLLGPTLEM